MRIIERVKEIVAPSIGGTIGATVGLLSVFVPWAGRVPNYLVQPPPTWTDPPIDRFGVIHFRGGFPYATQYGFLDLLDFNSAMKLSLIVFLAGTMVSLVTRLGGLLQVLGLIGFGVEFSEFIMVWRTKLLPWNSSQFEFYLSAGCALAAISTFLVLSSGKRALMNPACGCVPCNVRIGALLSCATRSRS